MNPGERHGRYELIRRLGEGGMGVVYEAMLHGPAGFRKRVALKVLKQGGAGLAREARLGGLLRHQNLVEVYALEQIEDTWVCAMELIDGGVITPFLPLPPAAVVEAAAQVCAGLAHAHSEIGLVHLDLKPDNLLVDHGTVKVADLGIARARGVSVDPTIRGTPAYMSPEQARGEGVDVRADVFSLGVLLITMATGMHGRDPERVPWLSEVLSRCLAPEPQHRFRSVRELREALLSLNVEGAGLAEALGQEGFGGMAGGATLSAEPTVRSDTWTLGGEARPRTNLTEEPDAFIGRQREVALLLEAIDAPGLVTLKGIGGLGKTRLARRVGLAWLAGGDRQVWFCDLAAARSETALVTTTAAALEVPLTDGDLTAQIATVGHAVAARGEILMVLDNFEQLSAHADVVARWQRLAPRARWLVTSREPLHLSDEHVVGLDPLPITEARDLLVVRSGDLGRSVEDSAELQELARRLDGIPLALELAAGRLGLLTPAEILDRLDQRFRLLRGHGRGLSDRQRTLRGALDWSWDLLDPHERQALTQLSVFEGGCTVEAAEAVLDLDGDVWALDALEDLVNRSLVGLQSDRLHLYESVRAYAAEKLEEGASIEVRHGEYFAGFGSSEALESLHGHGGIERWTALARERDNLMAAVRRACRRGDAQVAAGAAAAAWEILELRGPLGLGVEMITAVLGVEGLEGATRAKVVFLAGTINRMADRPDEAVAHFKAALEIWRAPATEDRLQQGRVLLAMSAMHEHANRIEQAQQNVVDALEIANSVGDRRGQALGLGALSTTQRYAGDMEAALQTGIEALHAHRRMGNRRQEVRVMGNVGHLHSELGRADESIAFHEAALELARQIGDRRMEGLALGNLAQVATSRGESVLPMHHAALKLAREVGSRRSEGVALSNMALFHVLDRNTDAAVALFGEAIEALRDAGSRRWEGFAYGNLGHTLVDAGRHAEAEAPLLEAIRIAAELDDVYGEASWQAGLAAVRQEQEDHDGARHAIDRSIDMLRTAGHRLQLAKVLLMRADLSRAWGAPDRAAYDQGRALATEIGAGIDKILDMTVERVAGLYGDGVPPTP